jgi:hypothetical protein
VTSAALLGVVDAVAWERSVTNGSPPAVDLCAAWSKLSAADFEEVSGDPRVSGSNLLAQIVGLEVLRRKGKVLGWKFHTAERGGPIRVDLQVVGSPKMIVLRA